MSISVRLNHVTTYSYGQPVSLAPQLVRLRPAPHCRTPIHSYSLKIEPKEHFINWQQDPHGNYLARLVFLRQTNQFRVEVDLIAEMSAINPFNFFVEDYADQFPFQYEGWLTQSLRPFLQTEPPSPRLTAFLETVDRTPRKTNDFLVDLNCKLGQEIQYVIRMEPGVQSPEQTLTLRCGSCRDTAWLLVQILRRLGLAARFVSGYLVQLVPDVRSLDGPSGPEHDFTDLHAWAEVYLPGAGWIGLDPTSGLLADEGHIPLACTPDPSTATPIDGLVDACESEFEFSMSVRRIHEDPRVTKPYTEEQWQRIDKLGDNVDRRLTAGDVRLTMGGEPTFVSIDDMEGDEWNIAALGPTKRELSATLIRRLKDHFATGGLLHFGQGKWYPGESLPRWAFRCYWRTDGQSIWSNPDLIADEAQDYGYGSDQARQFGTTLAARLKVSRDYLQPVYEDVWQRIAEENRLPFDVDPFECDLDSLEERRRLADTIGHGLKTVAGYVLPLKRQWWQAKPFWASSRWPVRTDRIVLIPGDSSIGLRLPLKSLLSDPEDGVPVVFPLDPLAKRGPLPDHEELRQGLLRSKGPADVTPHSIRNQVRGGRTKTNTALIERTKALRAKRVSQSVELSSSENSQPANIICTALCVEAKHGRLHVFMPPVETAEDYLDLIAAVEETADTLNMPVVIEGYLPPADHRLNCLNVTPDPGVIEVNVHPAHDWRELCEITTTIYEEARLSRLGAEKFDLDGKHTGTGGGNHVVLGGPTPADSPFLRRPDLLKSLIGYWNNHPSLSYLFSGTFIGPTSQAPRVDEGRRDAIYEMQIAFEQVPQKGETVSPWLVDRIFRHLLVDVAGNTHRAEFCIDKLYSPDTSSGRLGLLECRAFEMPPHARMSLTQQLLLRALVAQFWESPYNENLISWGTALHDRFMLPYFVREDFRTVISDLNRAGFPFEIEWFAPHFEFRFPLIGKIAHRGIELELRQAIEPWYVLGEEPGETETARYVDSSVERLQVRVCGMTDAQYLVTCNGRKLPLHPTGTVGEYVAGVRYRAWQPPNCLHPTIPVHTPLVFDIVDAWQQQSLGGCQYHVDHPGGVNKNVFPVNALEAEGRRVGRFFAMGHTGGSITVPHDERHPDFPMTLDFRRAPSPR